MPALRRRNKCPNGGSRTTRRQRSAESAQLFSSVVCAGIVERGMKVSRPRQHQQAQRRHQHEAEATLQPVNGGQTTHEDATRIRTGRTISQGNVLGRGQLSTFQRAALPFSEICSCLVRALQELEQRCLRRSRAAHAFIGKDELSEGTVVTGGVR